MSDPDRGAYTPPTDAPLSFDARQPVRGSRPAPIMLIVSALVLVLLVVAIVMFYRSGVREAGAPPQAVGAPVGEMKAAPPATPPPTDPAAGLQIYQSDAPPADGAASPTFTPPPEEPQVRLAPPVAPPPPKAVPTAPVTATPQALPPAKVVTPPPPPPPPAKTVATPAPKAVTPPPAKTTPAPAPKVATPAPAPAPKAASGSVSVQVGAVSSQALADKTWSEAVAAGGGSGRGKRVEAVQKGDATLYRTQVTGFADRAAAQAFCDRLKAAGKACFVK